MRKSKVGADYPDNWKDIADRVKREANWRCIRCNRLNDRETGHVLTVHHLDLDPSNNEWWNLVALCQKCHLSIQGKVVMERYWMFDHSEWFRPYVAGYYAHLNGHPTDREYVMNNLDMLLEFGRKQ